MGKVFAVFCLMIAANFAQSNVPVNIPANTSPSLIIDCALKYLYPINNSAKNTSIHTKYFITFHSNHL